MRVKALTGKVLRVRVLRMKVLTVTVLEVKILTVWVKATNGVWQVLNRRGREIVYVFIPNYL